MIRVSKSIAADLVMAYAACGQADSSTACKLTTESNLMFTLNNYSVSWVGLTYSFESK